MIYREVKNCLNEEIQEIVGIYFYTYIFSFLHGIKFLTKYFFQDILAPYGLDEATVTPIIEKLKGNPEKFVDFMMKFELNLERPDPSRSLVRSFL
jgi:hypothetical protein